MKTREITLTSSGNTVSLIVRNQWYRYHATIPLTDQQMEPLRRTTFTCTVSNGKAYLRGRALPKKQTETIYNTVQWLLNLVRGTVTEPQPGHVVGSLVPDSGVGTIAVTWVADKPERINDGVKYSEGERNPQIDAMVIASMIDEWFRSEDLPVLMGSAKGRA